MATEIFKKKKSLCRKEEFLRPSGGQKRRWGIGVACSRSLPAPPQSGVFRGIAVQMAVAAGPAAPGEILQSKKRRMAPIFPFLIYK